MTSPTTDRGKCATCNRSHDEEGYAPRHPFNDGTLGVNAAMSLDRRREASEKPTEAPWPFDPVLRQALIDKGVLTPQDLTDAEAKIRAVTAAFWRGAGNDNA